MATAYRVVVPPSTPVPSRNSYPGFRPPSARSTTPTKVSYVTPVSPVRMQNVIGSQVSGKGVPPQVPKSMTPVKAAMPARVLYPSAGRSPARPGNPVRIAGIATPPTPAPVQKASYTEAATTAAAAVATAQKAPAVVSPAPVAAAEKAPEVVSARPVAAAQKGPEVVPPSPVAAAEKAPEVVSARPVAAPEKGPEVVPPSPVAAAQTAPAVVSPAPVAAAQTAPVVVPPAPVVAAQKLLDIVSPALVAAEQKLLAVVSPAPVAAAQKAPAVVSPAPVAVAQKVPVAVPPAPVAAAQKAPAAVSPGPVAAAEKAPAVVSPAPVAAERQLTPTVSKAGAVALHRLLRVPIVPSILAKILASVSGETKEGLLKLDGLLEFDLFASSDEKVVAYCCYNGEAALKASEAKVERMLLKSLTACAAGPAQTLSATGGKVTPAGVKVWSLRGNPGPQPLVTVEAKPAEPASKVSAVALHRLLCMRIVPGILSKTVASISGGTKEVLLKLDGLLAFDMYALSAAELIVHCCYDGEAGLKASEAKVEDVLKLVTASSTGSAQQISAKGGKVTPAGLKVWSLRGTVLAGELDAQAAPAKVPSASAAVKDKSAGDALKASSASLHRLLYLESNPGTLHSLLDSLGGETKEGLLKLDGLLDFALFRPSGRELIVHCHFDGEAGLKACEAKVDDVLKTIAAWSVGTTRRLSAKGGKVRPAGAKVWSLRVPVLIRKPPDATYKVESVQDMLVKTTSQCCMSLTSLRSMLSQKTGAQAKESVQRKKVSSQQEMTSLDKAAGA